MTTQRTSYAEDGESTSSAPRRTISSLYGKPAPTPPAPVPVSTLHKAARACAKQGTPIFPCQPDGKAPLHGISIADASVDPEQIDAWWSAEPEANIGFCPGSLGVLVVDADPRKAGFDPELFERLRGEARRVQRTASAVAQHLFFLSEHRHVGRVDLAPGFACYFDNEHVLLSPSRVGGTTYRMLQNSDTLSPFPAWAEEMRREAGEGVQGLRQDWEQEAAEPTPSLETQLAAELAPMPFKLPDLSFGALQRRNIKPMDYLIKPWFHSTSSVLCAAYRGTGKTWFGYTFAMSLAGGIPMLGDWVPTYKNGVRVLYIDGEMALNEVRNERLNPMFATVPPSAQARIRENLFYLSHEDFPESGIPDLATPEGQELVEQLAARLQVQVIILDNKSCLFPSVPEIDGDPTAALNSWLLRLRRQGKSTLLFHHGGKPDETGRSKQRGTSRIEDVMTATILLARLTGMGTDEFALKFDKSRGFTPEDEFRVLIGKGGWLERTSPAEENAARARTVRELAEQGVKGREIAERLSISPATVSRMLKRKDGNGDASEGAANAGTGHSE
jgi:hypothetical protein